MSDWLTQLEKQRTSEEAIRKGTAEAAQIAQTKRVRIIKLSYSQNKSRYDAIYESIELYAKRAADMGFNVHTGRNEEYLSIIGSYSVYDGNVSTELVLTPWGNGFIVDYIGRVNTNPRQRFSFYRVTDRTITNWVKWAAGEGPDDPKEEFWVKIILCSIGLGILTFIGVVILVSYV